tara:strand:+ start:1664 stop:2755 length:1092 start_codon:yes stop_codon:yes gene_type:complete
MSVNISYKKQAGFFLIAIIILLAAVEGSARAYEYVGQDCNLAKAETLSNIDFFSKLQICYDQQNIVYSYTPVDSIVPNQHFKTVNINNDGFRGPEIKSEKSNDDFRIIVIGGSTVFGSGLSNDDQTIPFELYKKFNEKYANVEVINAGISSITSFEEVYHIKHKLVHLDPDMIIVYDGVNDIFYRVIDDPEIIESTDEFQLKDFQKYLRSPVVFYRHILLPILHFDVLGSPSTDKPTALYDEQVSNNIAQSWERRIAEFCQVAREHQFESVVVIQPSLSHGIKPLSDYERSIQLENIHRERTFEKLIQKGKGLNECSLVLDFSDVFENTNAGVYIDQVHVNNLGNKIIAEKIYEKILHMVIEN